MQITIEEEIRELKRELALRNRLYPEWVKLCKLRPEEARYQIACLQSTLKRLEAIDKQQNGEQTNLF
ncbi:MAG: hypothetical protein ACK505_06140 [Flavobacteriales bacterium]|jgi:hypothetical protein